MNCTRSHYTLKWIGTFVFLFSFLISNAQKQDSLLLGLYPYPDTVYVDKLIDASKKFRNQEIDRSLEYALKTKKYFSGINEARIGKSYAVMGIAYDVKGKYDSALFCLNKSLVIAEKVQDTRGKASVLLSIGVVNLNKGNYDDAISYY